MTNNLFKKLKRKNKNIFNIRNYLRNALSTILYLKTVYFNIFTKMCVQRIIN